MKDIAIFGSGGFGREVQMLIEQINQNNKEWNFIGFFDDGIEKNTVINDMKILGGIDELNKVKEELFVAVAVGNPVIKKKLIDRVKNNFIKYPVLIHPNVQKSIEKFCKIGEGTIITANNIVSVNVAIGKHVLINLNCTVGHDVKIGDFSSIMPAVNISGEIKIAELVYIGVGAKIRNGIKIGRYSTIGMGAVVLKDVEENTTVAGNPARRIK